MVVDGKRVTSRVRDPKYTYKKLFFFVLSTKIESKQRIFKRTKRKHKDKHRKRDNKTNKIIVKTLQQPPI